MLAQLLYKKKKLVGSANRILTQELVFNKPTWQSESHSYTFVNINYFDTYQLKGRLEELIWTYLMPLMLL
jgi:hypothetical protein